jgi:acyl-CoA dehydrogenase
MALDFDSARLPNPHVNESHHQWRNQLRRFVEQDIAPYADQWDEQGEIPDALWHKAGDIGLFGVGFDEKYGGLSEGIDIWHNYIVHEELSRAGFGGITAALTVHGISLPSIVQFAAEHIKQEVVPAVLCGQKRISLAVTEPSGGSDVANIQTKAVKNGEHYIVSGSKTFITGGMKANWYSTAVRTGDAGAGGVSLLLIPAHLAGIERTALNKKQGWWCSDTATIYFDNVQVPAVNLIGQENKGFQAIMANFNTERLGLVVDMEAFSRVCLEEAVNWAQDRHTFGKRLADHQAIRHKIVEMKQRINATQAYIQACTLAVIAGKPDAGDIAMLKVQASQTMEYCAREAMQILGGAAYLRGNRVERIYREVRVNAIGGGSEEIMRDLASRQYGV